MTDYAVASVPQHLGFILDGNRRWAKANGLPTMEGHRRGYDNLKDIAEAAINQGVSFISAFIFSTENWNRTPAEVKYLMELAYGIVTKDVEEMHRKNIRLVWLGTPQGLSKRLIKAIEKAVEKTKDNTRGTLCLCFNYGGHQEIADAAQQLLDAGETEITPAKLSARLYGGSDIPAVDYVVRTSGEQRLSNFMLWRVAYAELYFTPKHWPEFSINDLQAALAEYAQRQRRFGK